MSSEFQLPSAGPAAIAVAVAAMASGIVALGVGTSLAKGLFPLVGAEGTTAIRVGLSSVILLGLWRPWRWRLPRSNVPILLAYGIALGCMYLTFYFSLRTIPLGLVLAIEFVGPLGIAHCAS